MQTVILTSSYGHEKKDAELRTAPFRYLASTNLLVECKEQFKAISWMPLEPICTDDFHHQTALQIHGGGFAKALYNLLEKNYFPCVIIFKYCSEGDNIPDAIELLNYSNQWLNLVPVDDNNACKLRFPPSWKFLFGNIAPKEIY